ncbi:TolB family protein [Longimicrobium sp.]|uniref:TolB family protein n=1 Tax=Longimicrobium sp. TaxID=2029185 RepID=UPI003B3B46BA
MHRRHSILGLALALVLSGCDGLTGPGKESGSPGLHVIGTLPSDTVLSTLENPLVVEVRDSLGRVVPGVEVLFQPVGRPLEPPHWSGTQPVPRVLVGESATGDFFGGYLPRTTDRSGRAAVRVRFGQYADSGQVVVSVPSLGYQDTARFTILPGRAVRVVAEPRDSALYVNATYALRGHTRDIWGNPRPDPVTFVQESGPVVVSGATVRGTAIGRARLIARSGTFADTAWVSVVPTGTLAARTLKLTEPDLSGRYSVVRFGLDGSGYQPVLRREAVELDRHPAIRWSPQGDHLLLTGTAPDGVLKIFRADMDGTARPLFHPPARTFDLGGAYSHDMAWIYFSRSPRGERQEIDLYRARPDGTGVERISPDPTQWFYEDHNPDPSPDGRYVAYSTNRDRDYNAGRLGDGYLRILDMQTGGVVALGLEAYRPVWSPDGQWIAFDDGSSIKVVRPNGSDLKVLSQPGYWHGVTWSPDGQWVVAVTISGTFMLMSVDGQHALPLAYTDGLLDPAWRPR